jgi:hypothetical protein
VGASEFIWTAEAADGQLICLKNGLSRAKLVDHLIELAAKHPNMIVGFDFAFGMPALFAESQGVLKGPEFWGVVALQGETWLGFCPWPFWGKPGKRKPVYAEVFRQTEQQSTGAFSTFQIGGAGAVGTGSIRGMPHLVALRQAGWSIWPFDPPHFPMAIEIYPRLLAGPVRKSSWQDRRDYLAMNYPDLRMAELAASTEDAFDAAVSALVMDEHREELLNLSTSVTKLEQLEGRIWQPS